MAIPSLKRKISVVKDMEKLGPTCIAGGKRSFSESILPQGDKHQSCESQDSQRTKCLTGAWWRQIL